MPVGRTPREDTPLSRRLTRRAGRATAVLLATTALSLSGLATVPAEAAKNFEYGSTLSKGIYHGYAYLKVGGYKIRAVQYCEIGQNEYPQYGPWVKKGKTSRTNGCPTSRFLGSGVEVKQL